MFLDRVALDLPHYEGLLAGRHRKDPGYGIKRPAGTDDWLLVATLSGTGRFSSARGDLIAKAGTLTLIPPGTPHDYGAASGVDVWEILWVHFHPPQRWLEMLQWPSSASGIASFAPQREAWNEIVKSFREVFRQCFLPGRRRLEKSMNALEWLILLCEAQLPEQAQPIDQRVQDAIGYVHEHLREPLSLHALGAKAHLSPSRFSHLFREQIGLAPLQYVMLQRMNRAAILLQRTALSVAEVAAEVGMEPFHFSARFKAQTGLSPRAYRMSALGQLEAT